MDTFVLVISSLVVILPIFVFIIDRKYFYYSIILVYPVIGQFVGLQIPFFSVTLNPSMLFGLLVLAITTIDFVTQSSKYRGLEVLTILFVIYALFISLFSPIKFESLSWAIKMATWLIVLLTALKTFNSKKDLRLLQQVLAVAVVVVIISFFLSKLGIYGKSQAYDKGIELYGGGFYSGKTIAYYLAITFFVLVSIDLTKRAITRYAFLSIMLCAVFVIVLSFVRAPIVALLVGFVFFQFFSARFGKKNYITAFLIILFMGFFLTAIYHFMGQSRYMSRWVEFEHRISEGEVGKVGSGRVGGVIRFGEHYLHKTSAFRKIFGSGLGSSFALLGQKKVIHNDFAEILMGCGIIGLLLYLCILLKIYFLFARTLKNGKNRLPQKYLIFAFGNFFVFLSFHMTNVTSAVFVLIPWAVWTGATISVGGTETVHAGSSKTG